MKLSERFGRGLALAFELHRNQERKGSGVPYVAHLLGVCSIALEHGASEDEAIAALLHDAVEDQGGAPTLARIEAELGAEVARIVEACTTTDTGGGWRKNKEAYVAHLSAAPPDVKRVATADKLYNARSMVADLEQMGEATFARFSGGREGVLWYYQAVVDALEGGPSEPLYLALRETVEKMLQHCGAQRR
jgi:GTP pyrophosphokinase